MWASGGFEALRAAASAPVGLTIGAFDGVHVGHQAMLRWFVSEAHAAGLQAVVLTFDPLPRQVLSPPPTPPLLSSLAERQAQLALLGVDGVVTLRFDRATAALTAQDFMRRSCAPWICAGCGSARTLRWAGSAAAASRCCVKLAKRAASSSTPLPRRLRGAARRVRSSRIRRALQAGDVSEAAAAWGVPTGWRA
jgi:riboflavin kinase/FMN adenylyltransferase